MLEQQNRPFFYSLMYRCKGPTAFLEGLYLDCFTSPLQPDGKLIFIRMQNKRNQKTPGMWNNHVYMSRHKSHSSHQAHIPSVCALCPMPNQESGGSWWMPDLVILVCAGRSDPVPY